MVIPLLLIVICLFFFSNHHKKKKKKIHNPCVRPHSVNNILKNGTEQEQSQNINWKDVLLFSSKCSHTDSNSSDDRGPRLQQL